MSEATPFGIYLHIPYCKAKCRYCDFYSHPGERGVPDAYVDALLRELHRFAPDAPLRPDTLYFGGGTPSLLDPADAARLIAAAQPLPGAEITLEANPETVTEDSLQAFREAGVNRISFGVQSARDSQLKTLGRPHTAKQARAAFAAARRAGFENISGDIMLALPHYTQAEFDETLELIEDGGAAHISAYLLKIEPDSAFGRTPPEGLPTSDEAADFYLYAVEQLEHHGYRQYEISNFCRPGRASRHNSRYWTLAEYLGFGPGAHSDFGGERFALARDLDAYLAGHTVYSECSAPSARERETERVMLALRTTRGVAADTLPEAARRILRNCEAHGLAHLSGGFYALTPRGFLVSNAILVDLLETMEL